MDKLYIDNFPRMSPVWRRIFKFVAEARDLLLLSCGTYDHTIRWIPPLNVTSAQINDGLASFENVVKTTLQ